MYLKDDGMSFYKLNIKMVRMLYQNISLAAIIVATLDLVNAKYYEK
jgi:hypothetical protein